MIWRPRELEIDSEDPFANDTLSRSDHVRNIAQLLVDSPESVVLAIDGEWGSGKTTFLRFLNAVLQSKQRPTVFFNAWEVDFVDDPLLALISEVVDVSEKENLGTSSNGQTISAFKQFGGTLLRRGVPALIRAGTSGAIDLDELGPLVDSLAAESGEELAAAAEDYVQRYEKSKDSLANFRDALSGLVSSIEEHEDFTPPLILFVDELDRCRPDFAISCLERIKHAFSVPGVSFVLGVNQDQLARSIRGEYGPSFDGHRYLNRLIDLRYQLPKPETEEFIETVLEASGLARMLRSRDPGGRERFIVVAVLKAFTRDDPFSLRLLQKTAGHLSLILRATPTQTRLDIGALCFLVALRQLDPTVYGQYMAGEKGALDLLKFVGERSDEAISFDGRAGVFVRASLYAYSRVRGEAESRLEELSETISRANESGNELRVDLWGVREEARQLEERMGRGSEQLDLLLDRIELARRFS